MIALYISLIVSYSVGYTFFRLVRDNSMALYVFICYFLVASGGWIVYMMYNDAQNNDISILYTISLVGSFLLPVYCQLDYLSKELD